MPRQRDCVALIPPPALAAAARLRGAGQQPHTISHYRQAPAREEGLRMTWEWRSSGWHHRSEYPYATSEILTDAWGDWYVFDANGYTLERGHEPPVNGQRLEACA